VWQERFSALLGRRLIYAADEYYLLTKRPFPDHGHYDGFAQEENGIGMAARFAADFDGVRPALGHQRGGFFRSIDAAPALGYRAPRTTGNSLRVPEAGRTSILTGTYGAAVLGPLLEREYPDVEIIPVPNAYFGGNIGVTGLMTGTDLAAMLDSRDATRRYLLPDVCLSEGRFLDGLTPEDLPRRVEIVETTGAALRRALDATTSASRRSIPVLST